MTYTTTEVAKASRATVRAIHLWDNQGLLGEVGRNAVHDRVFEQSHIGRARLITAARMAGMSLAEIDAAFQNPKAMADLHTQVEDTMIFLRRVRDDIYREYDL